MTRDVRDANSPEAPERLPKPRRSKADPSPLRPPDLDAPNPPLGDAAMNPQQSASAVEKDRAPSSEPDEAQRFEQVRQMAYELYLERGGVPGDDVADWLEAERRVDAKRPR